MDEGEEGSGRGGERIGFIGLGGVDLGYEFLILYLIFCIEKFLKINVELKVSWVRYIFFMKY